MKITLWACEVHNATPVNPGNFQVFIWACEVHNAYTSKSWQLPSFLFNIESRFDEGKTTFR